MIEFRRKGTSEKSFSGWYICYTDMDEMGYEDMKWIELVECGAHNRAFITAIKLPVR
jgi:hypothetical protein